MSEMCRGCARVIAEPVYDWASDIPTATNYWPCDNEEYCRRAYDLGLKALPFDEDGGEEEGGKTDESQT